MKNRYFVVQREQIIAEDLAHAIRSYDAGAQIHVFRSSDEALAALTEIRPSAVLLHHEPKEYASTPVTTALQALGVPFAFTGMLPDAATADIPVLASPFTEVSVAALLEELHARRAGVGD